MWDDQRQLNGVALALALCAVVALAIAAVTWLVRQPAFAFREVVITTPLNHASGAHLESVVREELAGTFFTLDLDRAGRALTRVPWVRGVALRRQWPRRLEIDVVEHKPLARWNDAGLVNTRGEVFTADWDADLPQFSGPEGRSASVTESVASGGPRSAIMRTTRLISARLLRQRAPRSPPIWRRGIRAAGPSQGANCTPYGGSERSERGGRIRAAGPSQGANYSHSGGSAAAQAASVGVQLTIELGRDDPSARLARFVAVHDRTIGALARAGRHIEQVDLRYRNGFAARVPGFREKPARKS